MPVLSVVKLASSGWTRPVLALLVATGAFVAGCTGGSGKLEDSGTGGALLDGASVDERDSEIGDGHDAAADAESDAPPRPMHDGPLGPCDPPDDAPVGATVVACGVYPADTLIQFGDSLYWVEHRPDEDGGTSYFIRMVPKMGGAPRTLAGDLSLTHRILTDGEFVYWIDNDCINPRFQALGKVNIATGELVVLVPNQSCAILLAVDDRFVYWLNDRGLSRVDNTDESGGSITQWLERRMSPTASVYVPPYLYWLNYDPTQIERVRLDTPETDAGILAPTLLASIDQAVSDGLALVGGNLYWTTAHGNGGGGVWRMPAEGGQPKWLWTEISAWDLVADDGHVYWTAEDMPRTSDAPMRRLLRAMPLEGLPPMEQPTQLGTGSKVVTDDQYVYWTSDDGVRPAPLLAIKKTALFGHD